MDNEDKLIEQPTPFIEDDLAEAVSEEEYPPFADDGSPAHIQEQPVQEMPKSFDEKHKLDFEGLLYIGYLTHEFVWMGHRFKIRTITTNEYLEVALLHKRFKDSIGDVRAYTAAVVSACIETVDGKTLPLPLDRRSVESSVEYAFRYIIDHWYPWVIDAVYEQFRSLEGRVESVMEEMGKGVSDSDAL